MSGFALLSLDLDGFKKINDQLGHLAGDQVLKQVAMRLEKMTSESITVFRTGGDEFAFLITIDAVAEEQLTEVLEQKCIDTATRIKELTKQPYKVFSKHYVISASIGIACFPTDANDIESLYSHSDLAMYKAKEAGKDGFSFYEQSIMQKAARRYELEDDLKVAIDKNELYLEYQPKVCLLNGTIMSAEALLRWQHPKYGNISPMEFIPIAEGNMSIISIGQWVLEQVCLQIVRWQEYNELTTVAANVSSAQLNGCKLCS